ncbi:putative ABC transporter [Toxoplasma gondii MAS]|uniref:Putative ABC transporter n=1 Tax=Toxoplasma gondii MAS TaxID=943118 RepID=A0A086QSJ6_TOXGO|nr:putative ABC transporter [Toxoplasma gondii MAS]
MPLGSPGRSKCLIRLSRCYFAWHSLTPSELEEFAQSCSTVPSLRSSFCCSFVSSSASFSSPSLLSSSSVSFSSPSLLSSSSASFSSPPLLSSSSVSFSSPLLSSSSASFSSPPLLSSSSASFSSPPLLSSSSASFSSPPLLSSSSASISSPSLLASSSASFSSSSSSCFSSSSGAFPASAASAGALVSRSKVVLKNINLSVHAGELTVVVGPSGGGKSSLLCALIGELVLLHGSVAVAGERPKEVLEGSGVFPVHRQGDEMPNPTGRSSEEVEQEKSRDATRNSGLARERSRAGTSSRVARTREEDGAHREVQKERGEAWRNGQEGGEEGGRRGEEPGDEGDREEAEHEQDDAEDSEAMEGIQVGYAAQQPWLFRGTVRENILFGRSFDAGAYHKVLTACALHSDLAKLACKDMTELDSGGQCLSG